LLRWQAYDLFSTLLRHDKEFAKFDFLPTQWAQMQHAEKLARYSEFACHELNWFLSRKDAPFFSAVIQPFLANKLNKVLPTDGMGQQAVRHPLPMRPSYHTRRGSSPLMHRIPRASLTWRCLEKTFRNSAPKR